MKSYLSEKKGQTLTEYSLVLLLIAIAVFVMLGNFGNTVNNTYSKINSSVPQ